MRRGRRLLVTTFIKKVARESSTPFDLSDLDSSWAIARREKYPTRVDDFLLLWNSEVPSIRSCNAEACCEFVERFHEDLLNWHSSFNEWIPESDMFEEFVKRSCRVILNLVIRHVESGYY
jgi:hypothetical protein